VVCAACRAAGQRLAPAIRTALFACRRGIVWKCTLAPERAPVGHPDLEAVGAALEVRERMAHGRGTDDRLAWRIRCTGDSVQTMPTRRDWTSVVVATFLVACARGGGSPTPAASPLTLKIVLTEPEAFEGKPIYALFELRNEGSDTVRIPPFGVNAGWLAAVLHRGNGSVVPGGRTMWVDYVCAKTCSDDPLAPGGARYEPFILQDLWGERGPLPLRRPGPVRWLPTEAH
jgi:hypothetical protein